MMAGIGVVVGVIFLSFIVTAGAATSANIASGKAGADIIIVPEGTGVLNDFYRYPFSYSSFMAASVEERIATLEGVESVSGQTFMGTVLHGGGCGALTEFYFIAIDPDDPFVTPWLTDNEPLRKGQVLGGSNMVGSTMETLTIYGWQLEKKASLPLTGTYVDNLIYVTPETAKELIRNSTEVAGFSSPPGGMAFHEGLLTAVYVKVSGDASIDAVADSISEEVKQVTVVRTNELASAAAQRLNSLLSSFTYLGGLTVGISVILVSSLSSITVNEKRREIGVLRAVGASKPFISKLLASQIVLVSVFGGIAGIVGASLAFYLNYQTIIASLRIPFIPLAFFDLVGIISISLMIAVATGAVAALYPAYKANKMDPYDAIRRESR
ncbi:MAG: FtsX-like permease family protein [Candidatus Bathyarchaeia archaeon]